jgi:23S rRNA (adenine2030-N6)-methyltransferase
MNYHHIYHAGNFADVFKHIILTLCLEKLHEKPAPFFVLDTHAGIGKYDLEDEKSLATLESLDGIKKILAGKNFSNILPERFLKILAKINYCEVNELPRQLKFYAGSPALIRDYLRSQDRAIFAELNREDFSQLRKNFAGSSKFSLLKEDGFSLIKSKLPPQGKNPEKRGLIMIDPAFEKDQKKISDDYQKIIVALQEAYKRFACGTYLVWYPIIKNDGEILSQFCQQMAQLKFSKILQITFDVGAALEETKMQACGMFIFNAPWQLDQKLKIILPEILGVLKKGEDAKFEVNCLKDD